MFPIFLFSSSAHISHLAWRRWAIHQRPPPGNHSTEWPRLVFDETAFSVQVVRSRISGRGMLSLLALKKVHSIESSLLVSDLQSVGPWTYSIRKQRRFTGLILVPTEPSINRVPLTPGLEWATGSHASRLPPTRWTSQIDRLAKRLIICLVRHRLSGFQFHVAPQLALDYARTRGATSNKSLAVLGVSSWVSSLPFALRSHRVYDFEAFPRNWTKSAMLHLP